MNKNNAFIHGIIPGGLTTTNEIRVLVCWLASRQPEGVPQNLLIDSLTLEGLANDFEITAAISALLENGQVVLEDDCVKLDGEGRRAAALLGDEIPPAVREKAAAALDRMVDLAKNKSETDVQIIKVSDGYVVRCSVLDIGTDLFSVSLFAPTREQAEGIRDHFLQDPGRLYQYNLFLLTGEDYTE